MNIVFYNTSSDHNDMNKELTEQFRLSANPVEPVDILAPVFKLGSQTLSSLSNVNYAYIADYHRYYYVEAPTATNNGTFFLRLNVDPLVSFKDGIRNLSALISRQEKNYNLYLPDPEFKVYAYTDKKTLKFSQSPFTKSPKYLLTVSGGA